jgi:multiple sugar transport system permease protein
MTASRNLRRRSLERRTAISAVIMLLPVIIFFTVFVYYPIGWSFLLSFMRYNVFTNTAEFIGFENFSRLIKDVVFIDAFEHTAFYAFFYVLFAVTLSLALAVLMEQVSSARMTSIYKFVYFIPVVSPLVVVSIIWYWLYEPQIGLLNYMLSWLGIPGQTWLLNPNLALPSIIAMTVWKALGYNMIIFVAGLKGIPSQYYEAATVDGANGWQRFWYVTLPLLKPITTFVTVISVIGSFQVFTQIYVMTQGGPVQSTTTVVYNIYENAFRYFQMGYASSMAVVLFIIILFFTFVQLKISKS